MNQQKSLFDDFVDLIDLAAVVNTFRAAELLDVTLLAMGRIVFDRKLIVLPGMVFYRRDVEDLLKNDHEYLSSLRAPS